MVMQKRLRQSFASIEIKSHPNIDSELFDFAQKELASEANDALATHILNHLKNIAVDQYDGTGEWDWLQKNKQNKFIQALHEKNPDTLSYFLTNMFRNEATYGYLSPSFSDAINNHRSVASDILCNLDSCREFTDIEDYSILTSYHGNPYGLKLGDGAILPDTPRHYYYSYKISRLLANISAPTLVEIGGGYGGLCLQNWKRFGGNCTITNVDLFPALVTAYFYLTKHDVPVNFITTVNDKLKKNCVNLVSANFSTSLTNIIPNCDIIFNSRSLCEMDAKTVSIYFKFINSVPAKYFYHENSNFLLFPESERHIEVLADDFPVNFDKYYLQSKTITPFTGGSGRYREYIYKNNKKIP